MKRKIKANVKILLMLTFIECCISEDGFFSLLNFLISLISNLYKLYFITCEDLAFNRELFI